MKTNKKNFKKKQIANSNKNIVEQIPQNKPQTDPMLNSLFKGQKFIDFQEPKIDPISHINVNENGVVNFSTDNYNFEQIEIEDNDELKDTSIENNINKYDIYEKNDRSPNFKQEITNSDNIYSKSKYFKNLESNTIYSADKGLDERKNIVKEFLKRDNYSNDTNINLQTNFSSPLKLSTNEKIVTTEALHSYDLINSMKDEENNNLDFLKTLYRLKNGERESNAVKRESYSFVNSVKQEDSKSNFDSRINYDNINNSQMISNNSFRDIFNTNVKVKSNITNLIKSENNSIKSKSSKRISNSLKSPIKKNERLPKSEKIIKERSDKSVKETSDKLKTNNENKSRLKIISAVNLREKKITKEIKNIMSLDELSADLSRLSSKIVCNKNEELVNYGSKPKIISVNEEKVIKKEDLLVKEIPIVEIDLFGSEDLKDPDTNNSLQLFPITEMNDFNVKIEDTYSTNMNQIDISNYDFIKGVYTSNNIKTVISEESSVLNHFTSEMNKKQNQTTTMPNQYTSNNDYNTNQNMSLNFSKFTNFVGLSPQCSKNSLISKIPSARLKENI